MQKLIRLIVLLSLLLFPIVAHAQWTPVAPNLVPDWTSFSLGSMTFSEGTLYVGGSTLQISSDSGMTWSLANFNPPLVSRITEITFYDKQIGALSTGFGGNYVTSDGGANWVRVLYPFGSRSISFLGSPNDLMTAETSNGQILTSSDFGQTWITTAFPQQWIHELYGLSKTDAIALGSPVSFTSGAPPPGFLYTTTDRGRTWVGQSFPIDYDTYSFAIDKCDPQTIYVPNEDQAGTTDNIGQLYITHDFGKSWTVPVAQPIPYLETSIASSQNAVYCSTTDGIIRSTDKGRNWKPVGGPWVPVDTRGIAVASDNVVFAIDNHGTLWRTFNAGGDSINSIVVETHFTENIIPTKALAGKKAILHVMGDKFMQALGIDSLFFQLQYRGNVLGFSSGTTSISGAKLTEGTHGTANNITSIPFILSGNDLHFDPAKSILDLTFDTYLSDTNTTDLTLLNFRIVPNDSFVFDCPLAEALAPATFSLDLGCSDPTIGKYLLTGKADFVADAVFPDPITPTTGLIAHISFKSAETGTTTLLLLDGMGREVQRSSIDLATPGESSFTIDAKNLPSGKYNCRIMLPSGREAVNRSVVVLR